MYVLGIESSCDETAAAVYSERGGLLSNAIFSQIDTHARYGGVVPELASRDHIRKISSIINESLLNANVSLSDISAIAYTKGPGLIGTLMVGASYGKALAHSLGVPAVGVHHMEAHLMAPMLEEVVPDYPFVALLVSGGHTLMMAVDGFGEYRHLGESVDDAVGEAFDKSAKLLGLPYPGGPHLSALAKDGDPMAYPFPRPMTKSPGLDFSFSGLKTAVRQTVLDQAELTETTKKNIAASFEQAVVDTLLIKCQRALGETGFESLVVAGGVSANRRLREQFTDQFTGKGIDVFFPSKPFCTDNAAMVAYTGFMRFKSGMQDTKKAISVLPRWPLTKLNEIV